MMQALHPLAMAGVDQHSDWRQDPVGRLAATRRTSPRSASASAPPRNGPRPGCAGSTSHVTGADPVTGRRYEASDPALLLWVHVALVESSLAAGQLFGTPLSAEDSDRYVAEMVVAAELVGVPRDLVPSSVDALGSYIASVRPELRCTPAASESMAYLLDPPGMEEDRRGDLGRHP